MNEQTSANLRDKQSGAGPQADLPGAFTGFSRRGVLTSVIVLAVAAGVYALADPETANHAAAESPIDDIKPAGSQSDDTKKSSSETSTEKVATLAGGCFWCTEAVMEKLEGVNDVVSGYIGGHMKKPTYKAVCTGRTGHAEAVEVYYDPAKVSFEDLLKVFFKTHDPTTLNRQGNDAGTQYRSSVFYHNDEQKEAAKKFIAKLNDSGEYRRPIVTKLEKAVTFHPAEEYHQDYFRLNPNAGYCQAIVRGKVLKTEALFGDKLKKN